MKQKPQITFIKNIFLYSICNDIYEVSLNDELSVHQMVCFVRMYIINKVCKQRKQKSWLVSYLIRSFLYMIERYLCFLFLSFLINLKTNFNKIIYLFSFFFSFLVVPSFSFVVLSSLRWSLSLFVNIR